jgi:tetratricopeptide (TPR) repeat protein
MRRAVWYTIATVGVLGVAGSVSIARSSDTSVAAPHPVASEARIRDLDIEFYRKRVQRDPRSAGDYTQLAGLYLQRGRERADNADLTQAEQNARRSLHLRSGRNAAAFGVLASSLLAQHRFTEALQVAHSLLAADSTSISAQGLLGETQLELGQYKEARRTLGSLATYSGDLSVAPRLARWHELHGRPEQARRLLRVARTEAKRRHGMPKEQVAWFHLRLGDLALRHGHLGEAERELRDGLGVLPNDYRLLGTMARLDAARHRWPSAVAYGERAIASALDPATLGVVGDAYAAVGDSAKAEEYYRTMEVTVLHQPGPFHRAWSLFLLDHDRQVPQVLAKVREELRTRTDIYGYDLLAWALYKSGRHREAGAAMAHALALGTRDATLFYHAGMIARALGDNAAARVHLQAALDTNPYWSPLQPEHARQVLDAMKTRPEE